VLIILSGGKCRTLLPFVSPAKPATLQIFNALFCKAGLNIFARFFELDPYFLANFLDAL